MRTTFFVSSLLVATLLASPAAAASRTFKATLTKVSACAATGANGSATIAIDDVTGAVTGTLVVTGIPAGATNVTAGIHNKNAGDNSVGPFADFDGASPNGTHAVTTTLNSIALPKILAGDGAIIVKAVVDGSNCTPGAIRGDLVEEGAAPADAGTTATPDAGAEPGSPVPGPQGTDGGVSTTDTDAGAGDDGGGSSDDGGCSTSPSGGTSLFATLGLSALALLFARRARKRPSSSPRS